MRGFLRGENRDSPPLNAGTDEVRAQHDTNEEILKCQEEEL